MSARKEKERGMDRDGRWEWIRGLTGNEVHRDGRLVASPVAAWRSYGHSAVQEPG